MSYTDSYSDLLIFQYKNKPKAKAHIEAINTQFEKVYDLLNSFEDAFDLDLAVGKQLDTLGKIVGISREVPFIIPKKYFGFDDNANSYPMDDLFETLVAYQMRDLDEPDYTNGQVNDETYRFFIRAKIIKNYVKSYMIDEDSQSLQDAIDFLFEGKAFVTDSQNMSLSLYIDSSYDFDMLQYLINLDLLPKPQAVNYDLFYSYIEGETFGFSDNANSLQMGDLDFPNVGGKMIEIYI